VVHDTIRAQASGGSYRTGVTVREIEAKIVALQVGVDLLEELMEHAEPCCGFLYSHKANKQPNKQPDNPGRADAGNVGEGWAGQVGWGGGGEGQARPGGVMRVGKKGFNLIQ